jgi:glutamate--cysteine ligase
VDTNLFPGGFNNLNPAFLPLCVQAAMSAIEKFCPDARSLLLIPENHTRNQFYLQNVAQIAAILKQTGLTVRLGSLNPEITRPTTVELPNGQSLLLEPLVRTLPARAGRLRPLRHPAQQRPVGRHSGHPAGSARPVVLPPVHAGWAVRRKSNHFAAYDQVANDFAKAIGIDPWRINPPSRSAAASTSTSARARNAWPPTSPPCSTSSAKSTSEYGIDETPSSSSRPMPAPTAWAS